MQLLTPKIEEEAIAKETRDEMHRWEDVSQEYEEQWRQHGYLGM